MVTVCGFGDIFRGYFRNNHKKVEGKKDRCRLSMSVNRLLKQLIVCECVGSKWVSSEQLGDLDAI